MLTLAFALATIFIFMQFGGRLAASQSLLWWTTFAFLGVATAFPEVLIPGSYLLGVELVSNLVLGGMVMLLLFQVIEHSAIVTQTNRRMRLAIANSAASKFVDIREGQGLREVKPAVLIVLPCFNEEEALPGIVPQLENIKATLEPAFTIDFCIVNDGSTDGSARLLKKLCPRNFINHTINIGVSGVLLTGFRVAEELGYSYVIQCDSDGQHPIQLIPNLFKHAMTTKADLLIGSRRFPIRLVKELSTSTDQSTSVLRQFGALILRISMQMFGRKAGVSDPTSGFRVFSEKAISALIKTMPDEYPEPEAVVLVQLAGLNVSEIGVPMQPRVTGRSSLSGIKSSLFMIKVSSALIGLRLRTLLR